LVDGAEETAFQNPLTLGLLARNDWQDNPRRHCGAMEKYLSGALWLRFRRDVAPRIGVPVITRVIAATDFDSDSMVPKK
jgi:hypothetical protein